MCLLLQVLQPFRDLVWLLRGGPPPGPAIPPLEGDTRRKKQQRVRWGASESLDRRIQDTGTSEDSGAAGAGVAGSFYTGGRSLQMIDKLSITGRR